MNLKTIVKIELAKREMTQTELAEQIGIPQQSLSRTLRTPALNQRSHWPKILDALGLELVVQPKKQS
ncbi:helix-turn-helix domain-containing protein [Deinococcus gobiensis]|uniref:HTH cro/C1-type domain-containing protein n=1 Tax=Deinococcus gobiensis (strain DSM 21396 / JCM 16679 / CGMCC 1.7299 / I-0) TaxID=745776 RepID=H8H1R1_DEIGI|nr:helix-turn-helix transcriptional regulator [Deinococcus gobiensis]AFD27458.1 hypothetical protein DGo_PB0189 [Deinococcus gobiensis I-0]